MRHSCRKVLGLFLGMLVGCSSSELAPADQEEGIELSGGETTVFDESGAAFALPARNLSGEHRDAFALGDHFSTETG